MLRRAAATATRNGRATAWFRRLLTYGPVTLPHLGRHHPQAQLQSPRGVVSAPPPPPLPRLCGARGYCSYRRMARRIPVARPDGYSSSDGEAEDPDALEEDGENTEPAGAGAEGDDGSEEGEVEGFMMDFSKFPGLGDGDGEGDKEGAEEGGK